MIIVKGEMNIKKKKQYNHVLTIQRHKAIKPRTIQGDSENKNTKLARGYCIIQGQYNYYCLSLPTGLFITFQ
jgi:hypothetical protein